MPSHDVLQFDCKITLHQLLPPVATHTQTHRDVPPNKTHSGNTNRPAVNQTTEQQQQGMPTLNEDRRDSSARQQSERQSAMLCQRNDNCQDHLQVPHCMTMQMQRLTALLSPAEVSAALQATTYAHNMQQIKKQL